MSRESSQPANGGVKRVAGALTLSRFGAYRQACMLRYLTEE